MASTLHRTAATAPDPAEHEWHVPMSLWSGDMIPKSSCDLKVTIFKGKLAFNYSTFFPFNCQDANALPHNDTETSRAPWERGASAAQVTCGQTKIKPHTEGSVKKLESLELNLSP